MCFGRIKPPPRKGEPVEDPDGITGDDGTVRQDGILPLVSTVIAMDQPTVIKVLEYHLNWFEATGFTDKQVKTGFSLILFDLILYVPSTIFQLNRNGSSWVESVLS